MDEGIGREAFAQRIGRSLAAAVDGGSPVPLRVDRVEDYGRAAGERFSAFLRGPADRPLSQGIHTLEADDREPLSVFLVPVGRDGGELEYEAAFNRAASAGP